MLTLLWAVNAWVGGDLPQSDLMDFERAAWQKIAPSVASYPSTKTNGLALLVDDRNGYFITYGEVEKTFAGKANGKPVTFKLVSSDEVSHLSLLKAEGWKPGEVQELKPIARRDIRAGTPLLVAFAGGTVRGEMASNGMLGYERATRRMTSLNELRFELPETNIAGALVFTRDGQFVGVLSASLQAAGTQTSRGGTGNTAGATPGGQPGGGEIRGQLTDNNAMKRSFGPREMTTAYTLGPEIMRRVLKGFASSDHVVKHPAVGLFVKDSPVMMGGVIVQSVTEKSPAEEAGVHAGDTILSMDNTPIKTTTDFAWFLLNLEAGQVVRVKLLRDQMQVTVMIKVGIAAD